MTCPFTAAAPLAGDLRAAYPESVATRYRVVDDPAAVREVLRRPDDFSPANALTHAVPLTAAAMRTLARVGFALPPVLASAEGPEHLRVRRVVAGFFSPARVAEQEPLMRSLTRERCAPLRQRLAAGDEVDLAAGLAVHVPPVVMERLTGVPTPPLDQLATWSRDSLELFWGWPDEERQGVLARSAADYFAWLAGAVDDAVRAGDGNLFAALHAAEVDVRRIRSLGYFLTIAGQETTAMLLRTVLATALRRGVWDEVGRDENTAGDVVRDVLATASSVPTWRRQAVVDTEAAGMPFTAGEELVLRLSGGHLDDDSLAFGYGVHRCLGAGLAEREARVVLHEAARALPGLTPTGAPQEWWHLMSFQHVERVMVTTHGREAAR